MSGGGLGPAGCWITHKGLETWARMAKERSTHKTQVGVVRSLPFCVYDRQPFPYIKPTNSLAQLKILRIFLHKILEVNVICRMFHITNLPA
jgi:hypothetical protein